MMLIYGAHIFPAVSLSSCGNSSSKWKRKEEFIWSLLDGKWTEPIIIARKWNPSKYQKKFLFPSFALITAMLKLILY